MKLKVTGLVLAVLAAVSMTLTAFASTAGMSSEVGTADEAASMVASAPEVQVEIQQPEQPQTPFVLNGAVMDGLTYRAEHGVYYITVGSFVTAMDPEAMVEEADGVVVVNSSAVVGVEDVAGSEPVVSFFSTGLGAEQPAEANVEEATLNLTAEVGSCYVEANGRFLYVEDGVMDLDGKAALPIRVLAKVFDLAVSYDGATQKVLLDREAGASPYLEDGETFYDEETLYWLSHIINAESGNQPMSGKIAVGNVVMNRVNSPAFPNTIEGVLFQKNQFSPAMSGSIYREPNAASIVAAKLVMDGAEALEDVLFFNRAGMNTRAARNRPFVATIGGHSFYA